MAGSTNDKAQEQVDAFLKFCEDTLVYTQQHKKLPAGAKKYHYALVKHFTFTKRFNDLAVLVKAGVDIDIPGPDGESALFQAVRTSNEAGVEYLLRFGANANHKSTEGYTPLFIMRDSTPPSIVLALLNAGADLSVQSKAQGHTPLHYFCQCFKDDAITLDLLQNHPDKLALNVFDKEGLTPMAHAIQNGKPDVVKSLYKAGAKLQVKESRGFFKIPNVFDALGDAREAIKNGPRMPSYTYKPGDTQRVYDFLEPIYRVAQEKRLLNRHISTPAPATPHKDKKKSFKL